MVNSISPGITVKEWDISAYVPGVSSSAAGIGGVFNWGPAEQPYLVSSEEILANMFGRPTDENAETFLIASNFLAYSNALHVSRAVNASSLNATNGSAGFQVKNDNDFEFKRGSIPTDVNWIGKFPGAYGNSLRVSVCASADAYSEKILTSPNISLEVTLTPGMVRIPIKATDTDTADPTVALSALNAIMTSINIGDILSFRTANFNEVLLKVRSKENATTGIDNATAAVIVETFVTVPEETVVNTFERRWEFYNLVDRAPGTSRYVGARGGSGDELHIVVVDVLGRFMNTPNAILEVWENLSRATDSQAENGMNNFYKTIINDSSRFIWSAHDITGLTAATSTAVAPITIPVSSIRLQNGVNGVTESNITVGELASAYDQFRSTEKIDISLIIAGKAIGGTHGEGIANYIIDNVASVRKDAIVLISPQMNDVVAAPYREVDNLVEFRNALRYSDRGFMTSSYKYQFDRYSNKYRWVAGCGDDAGLIARTEFERDTWWSPAGENRGQYKNVAKLAFSPDKPQRDVLYKNDINPVVTMIGAGTMLYGDKTLLGKPSAFDRVNVRRLFDMLEKAISIASRGLLFEHNTVQTRARFRNIVEPYLRDIMGRGGIIRFEVICDETNNTPAVIDRNEFVGSIFIVPAKSINFITLNFVAVANALSFDLAIGLI